MPEKGEKFVKDIEFPEGLSKKDIELIYEQCRLQRATDKDQILGFAQAYKEAKELAESPEQLRDLTPDELRDFTIRWAKLVEIQNAGGFRKIPLRFRNMSFAIDQELVPRAMENFFEAYAAGKLEPEELYREFEEIHPFFDGNGRVGDLLWKIAVARKIGNWPEELPPDVFGEEVGQDSE